MNYNIIDTFYKFVNNPQTKDDLINIFLEKNIIAYKMIITAIDKEDMIKIIEENDSKESFNKLSEILINTLNKINIDQFKIDICLTKLKYIIDKFYKDDEKLKQRREQKKEGKKKQKTKKTYEEKEKEKEENYKAKKEYTEKLREEKQKDYEENPFFAAREDYYNNKYRERINDYRFQKQYNDQYEYLEEYNGKRKPSTKYEKYLGTKPYSGFPTRIPGIGELPKINDHEDLKEFVKDARKFFKGMEGMEGIGELGEYEKKPDKKLEKKYQKDLIEDKELLESDNFRCVDPYPRGTNDNKLRLKSCKQTGNYAIGHRGFFPTRQQCIEKCSK
jgi:hypothetical protein